MAASTVPTVSELTSQLRQCVETAFAAVQVCGEVASVSRPSSGHVYFNLKDAGAALHAVMWRSSVARCAVKLEDGIEVVARGRLAVYPPRGEYQMVVEELQQKGLGAQDLALRLLKERLARAGYFDRERKRRLPRFPKRIALVASPTGAAIRDMLEILRRRWPAVEVWVCATRVQGDGAADDIFGAMRRLHTLRVKPDVIILARGGGSAADLSVFNEERVATAIFQSCVPVISAIGHEVDVTLADLVADFRAITPSEAAERATPDRSELLELLRTRAGRLRSLLQARFQSARQSLQKLSQRRVFLVPADRLRDQERRLDELDGRMARAIKAQICQLLQCKLDALQDRLARAMKARAASTLRRNLEQLQDRLRRAMQLRVLQVLQGRLDEVQGQLARSAADRVTQARKQIEAAAAQLDSLSPLNVLARGYSLTRSRDSGTIVHAASQVEAGARLEILLHDGKLNVRVEGEQELVAIRVEVFP